MPRSTALDAHPQLLETLVKKRTHDDGAERSTSPPSTVTHTQHAHAQTQTLLRSALQRAHKRAKLSIENEGDVGESTKQLRAIAQPGYDAADLEAYRKVRAGFDSKLPQVVREIRERHAEVDPFGCGDGGSAGHVAAGSSGQDVDQFSMKPQSSSQLPYTRPESDASAEHQAEESSGAPSPNPILQNIERFKKRSAALQEQFRERQLQIREEIKEKRLQVIRTKIEAARREEGGGEEEGRGKQEVGGQEEAACQEQVREEVEVQGRSEVDEQEKMPPTEEHPVSSEDPYPEQDVPAISDPHPEAEVPAISDPHPEENVPAIPKEDLNAHSIANRRKGHDSEAKLLTLYLASQKSLPLPDWVCSQDFYYGWLAQNWQYVHDVIHQLVPIQLADIDGVARFEVDYIACAQHAVLALKLLRGAPEMLLATGWKVEPLRKLSGMLAEFGDIEELASLKTKVDCVGNALQDAMMSVEAAALKPESPANSFLSASTARASFSSTGSQWSNNTVDTTPATSPEVDRGLVEDPAKPVVQDTPSRALIGRMSKDDRSVDVSSAVQVPDVKEDASLAPTRGEDTPHDTEDSLFVPEADGQHVNGSGEQGQEADQTLSAPKPVTDFYAEDFTMDLDVAEPSIKPVVPVPAATPTQSVATTQAASSRPLCTFFQRGACTFGDKCRYRHELAGPMLSTGPVRPQSKRGQSSKNSSPYARPYPQPQQLASTATKSKRPCRFFGSVGGCRKGDDCPFVHIATTRDSNSSQRIPIGVGNLGERATTHENTDVHNSQRRQHAPENQPSHDPAPHLRFRPPFRDPSRNSLEDAAPEYSSAHRPLDYPTPPESRTLPIPWPV
ncbi:hypothetical protein BDV95DRAFT_608100 [Massariosphaeria phaeospora]|uniref:C3H1-type domain-containing protein n=1 Tax=Massariosphaeria phaeospora TaxID=100035 RepID=A0A7C8M874_9PLEO|nr:hypothetical protein BDV95DRAFT_608100 [Massariosphaeria phaeospora]